MATFKKAFDSGMTLYGLLRNQSLQIWDVVNETMTTYASENYQNYVIPAAEQTASGFYFLASPENLPDGIYSLDWRLQLDVNAAESDICVGLDCYQLLNGKWYVPADNAGIADSKSAAEAAETAAAAAKTAAENAVVAVEEIAETIEQIAANTSDIGETVWEYADRSLTGTTVIVGQPAISSEADGYATCPQGGTIVCYRLIKNWDGELFTPDDVETVEYSIYRLSDEGYERTPVSGHVDRTLEPNEVIFSSPKTDGNASSYNFRHLIDVSQYPAFERAGTTCLVEYKIIPKSPESQIKIYRYRVKVE